MQQAWLLASKHSPTQCSTAIQSHSPCRCTDVQSMPQKPA
jgi:hypothetical protein